MPASAGAAAISKNGASRATSPNRHASTAWLHTEGIVNGICLHWVEAGRRQDPLVILLHGFPEFWFSWESQIVTLSSEGYRVVAPDLRGYNFSQKPKDGYDLFTLSTDIYELASLLTDQPVALVGHDWGGVIAWAVAARFPDKITQVCVCNAPHPGKLRETLSWSQQVKFWHIWLYQIPFLPEWVLGWNRSCWLARGLNLKATDTLDKEMMTEIYRDAMSQRGALRCMLAYYRYLFSSYVWGTDFEYDYTVHVPVLILWGDRDSVLEPEWLEGLKGRFVTGHFEVLHFDADHWLHRECPEQVSSQISLFLRKYHTRKT
jgi:pimeloyl-ACP methyl ester carboxylesterase